MLLRLVPLALLASACTTNEVSSVPWPQRAEGWRTDPAWYDGKAEKCVYDATCTIYGVERRYDAMAYTNKQAMDEATTTKAADNAARRVEVFKHHWSERVPTENYDYDFSTATFTRTDDLAPYKLTAATQEDCGASFKQLWRDGRNLRWLESVYFPGTGLREGSLAAGGVLLGDALTLVLRDFPFETATPESLHELRLVASQRSTRPVPFEPMERRVRYDGPEVLELPIGTVLAQRLTLLGPSGGPGADVVQATYWFAAEADAPWLHALVRYEDPEGRAYRLRSLERSAYWER